MLLIDTDSQADETILYLSALILNKMKIQQKISVNNLDIFFNQEIPIKIPQYKYYLALNFLYLLNKIDLIGSDIVYVHK